MAKSGRVGATVVEKCQRDRNLVHQNHLELFRGLEEDMSACEKHEYNAGVLVRVSAGQNKSKSGRAGDIAKHF